MGTIIDSTKLIANQYTKHVHNWGPERSAQRNYGVRKSSGDLVTIIDSDMVLSSKVIEECVNKFCIEENLVGVTIPEESFGTGFWAKCKKLERSYYIGVDWMEAARMFPRTIYDQSGGYDEDLVSGEDWDLSDRIKLLGPICSISELIYHNEGHISLYKTLRKKYYYGKHARAYLKKSTQYNSFRSKAGPLNRYRLLLSHPQKLFKNPMVGVGVIIMKTLEYSVGYLGYVKGRDIDE